MKGKDNIYFSIAEHEIILSYKKSAWWTLAAGFGSCWFLGWCHDCKEQTSLFPLKKSWQRLAPAESLLGLSFQARQVNCNHLSEAQTSRIAPVSHLLHPKQAARIVLRHPVAATVDLRCARWWLGTSPATAEVEVWGLKNPDSGYVKIKRKHCCLLSWLFFPVHWGICSEMPFCKKPDNTECCL